jgi:hypothetical protein
MKKETYLEKIEKHYQDDNQIIGKAEALKEAYISSTDKEKELIERQFDEDKKELDLKNYYSDVRGIKNNVQFFFWIFIISIILTIIFVIF